ncbi:MAG: acyl-ACP--UDP-N-acetylglucosamine O-acyltransferase [Elusimicrobia bacterium]|nr:acyl-ACP--UDP-N-acetylglucosamine O-acyltransferase [Elusimicrobiota bacterium]
MIHPTAIIHPTAQLDKDVKIGPYAVIGENVVVAQGTSVGAHAFIEFASIGKDCLISPHAFIGTPPQDVKYKSEPTRLILGDKCIVRECVTLNRGTMADGGEGITRIGNSCFFMAYSHVAHDCVVGNNVVLINCAALAGHVTVEDNVMFGGLSAAHQFVRIGRLTMVGGATGVERDAPPFSMIEGNRGRIVGINIIGLRRNGFNKDQVVNIKKAFDLLFRSGQTLAEALNFFEKTAPGPELKPLLDFLKAPSKRGITNAEKTGIAT